MVESSVRFFCAEFDHDEALIELGDGIRGLARGLGEVAADPVGHAVEALIDGAGEVAVPRDAELGEGLEPPFQLGELGVLLARIAPPPAHMHGDDDHQHHEREHREAKQPEQDKDGVERVGPHPQWV